MGMFDDSELRQDYRKWAIACFKMWERLPDPMIETRIEAKQIRATYLSTARSVLQLCQPPEKATKEVINLEEFLRDHETIAAEIQDILSLLKDSADWAVSSLDETLPQLPLYAQEINRIQQAWDFSPDLNERSPGLAMAFASLARRLKENCPLNRRTRIALVRAEWAFKLSKDLVSTLKDGNPWVYIKGINRDQGLR